MYKQRRAVYAKSLKGGSQEEPPKLDTSKGTVGLLAQILPVVCAQTGHSKSRRIQYLNTAVQAIKQLGKPDVEQNHGTFKNTKLFQNDAKNSLESEKSNEEPSTYSTPKKDSNGFVSSKATPDTVHIHKRVVTAEYIRFYDDESSCSSNVGDGSQRSDTNGLDFREEITLAECFCMLRCTLVYDSQEVRGAGLRLIRYLITTPQDAKMFFAANTVPLIVRCLDKIGLISAAERIQTLRLIRKILQLSKEEFPHGIISSVVSLCNAGLQNKDNFYHPALALLCEMTLCQTEASLTCGAANALQTNVLECGGVPRIQEALLGSLLRLVNDPNFRFHTSYLLQVLAPFTDYHYRHTPYDLKPVSHGMEREQRLYSARLCAVVLLRSWPGLLLMCKDNLAALRSLTAQLAHSPHTIITKSIINLLYEVFCIPESSYFKRESVECERWSNNLSSDSDSPILIGGSEEIHEWDDVITAHLNTPVSGKESWSLFEGFVAAEAKESLPHFSQNTPNLTQGHQALVLHAFIKADLFGALSHTVINSDTPLAMRAAILLGELSHRAHKDLPLEFSHLIHTLPELINQAATNYDVPDVSFESFETAKQKRTRDNNLSLNSLNPLVKLQLNRTLPPDDKLKGSHSLREKEPDKSESKSSNADGSNLFSKLFLPDQAPTNPYSIPTHTYIKNNATSNLTQSQRKARALLAVGSLLKLTKGRLNPSPLAPRHSPYLAHMMRSLPSSKGVSDGQSPSEGSGGMVHLKKNLVVSASNDLSKMSKWLNGDNEHDELIQRSLKQSHIMNYEAGNHDPHNWNWDMIISVLRWPSSNLQKISSNMYRLFIRRLVHFFKPSAEVFSTTPATHVKSRQEIECLMVLAQFLVVVPENDAGRHLEELLLDVLKCLKEVTVRMPSRDVMFAPSKLAHTCSQYYFLLIGVLCRSCRGHHMLSQANILSQLQEIIFTTTNTDVYAKLISSTLDYTIDGQNRRLLQSVLHIDNKRSDRVGVDADDNAVCESVRLYGTGLLRCLLRCEVCPNTLRWLTLLLVEQLYDPCKQVRLLALSVLYEVTEVDHILQTLARDPPTLPPNLGAHSQLLMARLLQSSVAYIQYKNYGMIIDSLIAQWDETYNLKYVQLQELSLSEALTLHRKDERGCYGRRSSSAVRVHDVFVYPHLYGSLALHQDGFRRILTRSQLTTLIKVVVTASESSAKEILILKSAIWALCHVCRSPEGLSYLVKCKALNAIVSIAKNSKVYTVRGTVFMALSLVATSHTGVMLLRTLGWESVYRSHHQRWQSSFCPVYDPCQYQQHHLPAPCNPSVNKANPYFTQPNEDNYIEHAPRSGFYLSPQTDEESVPVSEEEDSQRYEAMPSDGKKAQTLPYKSGASFTSCGRNSGHQRSLSDVPPVLEENNTQLPPCSPNPPSHHTVSPHHSGGSSNRGIIIRSSLRIKSKLLLSMRKRSERKRQDSVSSTGGVTPSSGCNGSTHPCGSCPSHFQFSPPPPLTPNSAPILTSSSSPFFRMHSPPPPTSSCVSSRRASVSSQYSPNSEKPPPLSPIASGGSLSVLDSQPEEENTPQGSKRLPGEEGERPKPMSLPLFSHISPQGEGVSPYGGGMVLMPYTHSEEDDKLHGCQILLAISESRRSASESPNCKKDFLGSLLSNSQTTLPSVQDFKINNLVEFPRTASTSNNIPSGGNVTLPAHILNSGNFCAPSNYVLPSGIVSNTPYLDSELYSEGGKFVDAKHSSTTDCYYSASSNSAFTYGVSFSGLTNDDVSYDDNAAMFGSLTSSNMSKILPNEMNNVSYPSRANRLVNRLNISNNDGLDGKPRLYMGLCLPSDLDNLLDTSGHWDKPLKEEKDNNGDDDKDKWRENKKLETLKEESFTSGEGDCANISKEDSITDVDRIMKEENVFTYHSSSNCVGCFSLCNRKSTPQTTPTPDKDSPITVRALEDEEEVDVVSVRKEIIRFVHNLKNPIISSSAEGGLLALKQKFPDCFRDVCMYTEVMEMLSHTNYSFHARVFLQEIFGDVPYKEVYDEASKLLSLLPTISPPKAQEQTPSLLKKKKLSEGNKLTKKNLFNLMNDGSNLSETSTLDINLKEKLYIKEEEEDSSIVSSVSTTTTASENTLSNNKEVYRHNITDTDSTPTATDDKIMADGGIQLLSRQLSADVTLSDWEGMSTDSDEG